MTEKLVAVFDLTDAKTLEPYGSQYKRGLVIHTRGKVIEADLVKINNQFYIPLNARQLRGKASYILAESSRQVPHES